jgi:hypothetical protein
MKEKNPWRYWAKAIGEKASKCDKESDTIAMIRTIIFATYLLTNCFIIAGVIRHWNDETHVYVEIQQAQPVVPLVNTKFNRTDDFE